MKKTLYLKFLLAYLIFGIFGYIVTVTFSPTITMDYLVRSNAVRLYSEANQIVKTYASELYNNEISLESVKNQLDAISLFTGAYIKIINPSGRVILDSQKTIDVSEVVMIEDFDPTVTGNSYYVIDHFFDTFEKECLTVIVPISVDYKLKGYVTIHLPMQIIDETCSDLMKVSLMLFSVILLLSTIILIFFTEIVYVPLKAITHATEQYASGNMHYEFEIDSDDEIGYLAGCLNYMASEIARAEDDQKKFVANVSHDFRSPLTSIRGYLDAMLDGTIPPEMYEKYLTIVVNETDRLTKLTNSLLTLNNLNTKGMLLDKSDFDINRVIRDTASSFEGICHKKTIGIELVLVGESLFVNADIEKIKQVLYNLLDNAIKFSHQNSVIRIESFEKKNKVFISVKDSGIGIPKDDLKMIWNRFYKSDLSRGKDKKGTGLGLSIVKEIINAHNENINVISTEGVGSEFVFTLPLSKVQQENDDLA